MLCENGPGWDECKLSAAVRVTVVVPFATGEHGSTVVTSARCHEHAEHVLAALSWSVGTLPTVVIVQAVS